MIFLSGLWVLGFSMWCDSVTGVFPYPSGKSEGSAGCSGHHHSQTDTAVLQQEPGDIAGNIKHFISVVLDRSSMENTKIT
jgi:hypothetical protein